MTKKYLFLLLKTGRWQLSLATALATVCGALLVHPTAYVWLAAIFTGSFLFSLSVTWFNQLQERQEDSLMARTKNRPLANNTLPVPYAIIWAGFCMAFSVLIFFACGGWLAVAILGVVVLFYNCIYTPMKRRSLLALILGAIAGAAPPVLGWVCAGGGIIDSTPLVLFLLFFLWQVPHFWLFAESNRFDYEAAKFPLLRESFGDRVYVHILVLWVLAFCIALLALPAFGFVHTACARLLVVSISAISMVGLMAYLLMNAFDKRPAFLARFINFSMAAICITLVAEKIFGG
jgi:heme o synthase